MAFEEVGAFFLTHMLVAMMHIWYHWNAVGLDSEICFLIVFGRKPVIHETHGPQERQTKHPGPSLPLSVTPHMFGYNQDRRKAEVLRVPLSLTMYPPCV